MITSGIFTTTLIIYCISVFGHVWPTVDLDDTERRFSAFAKEDCRRLQTLQNETLRLRLRAPHFTPVTKLISRSGELSVHQLVGYHTLLQVQKVIANKKPAYIARKPPLNKPVEGQAFAHRQTNTISVNGRISSLSRSAFIYKGAALWNQLPLSLRNCEKTETFKYKVQGFLC